MDLQFANLTDNRKVFLASDFHLGAPDDTQSRVRENKIINWLESIEDQAAGIILVGDLFDFWFEYQHVVMKGFVRFQGKIAELTDRGIPVIFFTGNHDLWMFNYFSSELGVTIERNHKSYKIGSYVAYIAHGDGLGPGDHKFKFFKKIFTNRLAQWAFSWFHPDAGILLAKKWSDRSRLEDNPPFKGNKEWLIQHSMSVEENQHHDFYIFGHRHIPGVHQLTEKSFYYNLGDWINHFTYLEIDQHEARLQTFKN